MAWEEAEDGKKSGENADCDRSPAFVSGLSFSRLAGFRVYSVISGSMEPGIPVGSLVYARKTEPEKLKEGEIIVYSRGSLRVVHRVIGQAKGKEQLFTKGDANEEADAMPVSYGEIQGKVVLQAFPVFGYPGIWIRSDGGKIMAAAALLGIIMFWWNGKERTRHEEEKGKRRAFDPDSSSRAGLYTGDGPGISDCGGTGRKSGLDGEGHTSSVEEEFEQPDLLEPGVEHRIRKEVKVKNEEICPCYVRVRILETSSEAEWSYEIGDEENWEKRGDFLFYKKIVAPGESTSSLIRAVRVQKEGDGGEFQILVYEESVQSLDPETGQDGIGKMRGIIMQTKKGAWISEKEKNDSSVSAGDFGGREYSAGTGRTKRRTCQRGTGSSSGLSASRWMFCPMGKRGRGRAAYAVPA